MNREQRRAAARAQRGSSKQRRITPGPRLANPVQHANAGVTPIPGEQFKELAMQGPGRDLARLDADRLVDHPLLLGVVAHLDMARHREVLAQRVADEAVVREDATQVEVCGQAMTIAKAGCEAALACSHRAARHGGRWGLTGPELTALNECMELHEQFLQMAPQWMVESAVLRAKHRAMQRRVEASEAMRKALRAAA